MSRGAILSTIPHFKEIIKLGKFSRLPFLCPCQIFAPCTVFLFTHINELQIERKQHLWTKYSFFIYHFLKSKMKY